MLDSATSKLGRQKLFCSVTVALGLGDIADGGLRHHLVLSSSRAEEEQLGVVGDDTGSGVRVGEHTHVHLTPHVTNHVPHALPPTSQSISSLVTVTTGDRQTHTDRQTGGQTGGQTDNRTTDGRG